VNQKTIVDDLASSIIHLVDNLNLQEFTLCGLSLCGMIVQTLLTICPERIRAAVIVNAGPSWGPPRYKSLLEEWKELFLKPNGPVKRLEKTWATLFSATFLRTSYAHSVFSTWTQILQQVS
jgi:pimeloyl-ACP methyl ester carboxylesterase